MAARVLALLAAVAMVVGAVVVRNALDDDDGGGAGGRLHLVCDTTLATVCEAIAGDVDGLDVKVEDAFDTFTRLSAADETADLDGWLVTAPWPGMVNAAQSRASRESLLLRGDVLARSPVVMAVHAARQAALAKRCSTDITWKCVGEVAGTAWADIGGDPTWGVVRPGHAPASTSTGLSVLGAGAVSYFEGRTDLSSADLDEGGFRDWLGRLERARPNPSDAAPIQTMLRQPSAYDVVGSTEADAGPAVASAARAKPALLYPSPVVTADVVLAVGKTKSGERIRRAVAGDAAGRALAAAGWRVQGQPPVAGVRTTVTLPSASNLPAPDVLQALLEAAEGAA